MKKIYTLLSGLILTAAIFSAPVFAGMNIHDTGMDNTDTPFTIVNLDPSRSS